MIAAVKDWTQPVATLIDALQDAGGRGWVVCSAETDDVRASTPALEPLAENMRADARDFDRHAGCFFEVGAQSGHLLGAFLHRTQRGQGAGGVRFWSYDSIEAYVRDGLRLSRGMGRKCALAGLWWGGGKGVIARRADVNHLDPQVRGAVFRDYGRFLSGLSGCYVTAEDVGTTPADMSSIFSMTRHMTCIAPELGGSGNPSVLTARGVVVAMRAALDELGMGPLAGKTVALQGLGHVSLYMIGDLLAAGVGRIVGADIDASALERVRETYPSAPLELRVAERGDLSILATECDVFAPNAVGGVINPDTIDTLRAPIVCGAANNPLLDPTRDSLALQKRNILFVPDFLANRMGIVNCANEQYGVFDGDPAVTRHLRDDYPEGIYARCREIFARAARSGRTPVAEAEELADELSQQPHPIWGNRAAQIIQHLVDTGWA